MVDLGFSVLYRTFGYGRL